MKLNVPRCRFLQANHTGERQAQTSSQFRFRISFAVFSLFALLLALVGVGCEKFVERRDVRPLVMRDVPANRLAYRFEADTGLPSEIKTEDPNDKLGPIQTDFNTNRKDDALLRTVL